MERIVLGIVDYIIFAAMLIISAGIGIFFRFSGSKQKTTEEYLLAGKDMPILPVAFSLMASFLSAIAVLGIPAEMYSFGTHMAFKTVGFIIGSVISSYIFLPVFFEVQAATAYEYLERRFGKIARRLSSLAFILHMMLYMPVVLYGPALALSAVTDLSTWAAVISVGAVCTFYCTLGGMKAVLWTDAFQTLLMFLGIFSVIIKGTGDVGSIEAVLKIANEGGRLVVPGFELGLDVRYTMWNMVGHSILAAMSAFGVNQVQVQRLLTIKNVSKARTALFVSIPLWCIFHLLNCFAGIVIYAYFANCDPMTAPNSSLTSPDQLLPYYMMSALSKYPGLAGLCICGIFSASLSTASSAVNSLTAVTMEDFVRPIFERMGMSEKQIAFSAKIITLSYGVVCLALTFIVAKFGNLIQVSFTIFGLIGGPLLSMFLLGMMTQRTNEKGIVVGLITAIAFSSWISWGTSSYAPRPKILPVSVEGCVSTELTNTTVFPPVMSSLFDAVEVNATSFLFFINNTETSTANVSSENVFFLYRISYMWIGPIGFTVCTIVGYSLSIIFNVISGSTKDIPEELLSPVLKFFLNKKPESGRKERKKSKPPELEIVNPITIGTQNVKEVQEINSKL